MSKLGKWLLAVGLVLLVLMAVYQRFMNTLETEGSEWDSSSSIAESRADGVFVRKARIEPETVTFNGVRITFAEAWLERRSREEYT